MSELLDPRFSDMRHVFETDFAELARIPCTYEELVQTADRLVQLIRSSLTVEERGFVVSIQEGSPDWSLLGLKSVENLPAVKWKLFNAGKMSSSKKKQEVEKLKAYLKV
ncbi:hypothetical protein ES703_84420 [subsurface metagenome]